MDSMGKSSFLVKRGRHVIEPKAQVSVLFWRARQRLGQGLPRMQAGFFLHGRASSLGMAEAGPNSPLVARGVEGSTPLGAGRIGPT